MDQTNKKMLNTQQEWIKQQQKNLNTQQEWIIKKIEYPTRMDKKYFFLN